MGALIPACAIIIGLFAPLPSSNRLLFTLCDLTGWITCVAGMASGTRLFLRDADLRLSYGLAISGASAVIVGLLVQTGGMLTANDRWARMLLASATCLTAAIMQCCFQFQKAIRQITESEK